MRTRMLGLALTMLVVAGCTQSAELARSVVAQHESALAVATETQAHQALITLAGEEMAGRRAGTKGATDASAWIANQFREIGLQPAGTESYFMPFTFPFAAHLVLPEVTLLSEAPSQLVYGRDFAATMPSGSGDVDAGVVFVGYAMQAPEIGYDDFAGIDLRGKIALVVRGAPGVGAELKPEYRSAAVKDANVAAHGGVGILYVPRPAEFKGEELQRIPTVLSPVSLPAVEISRGTAERLLGADFDLDKEMRAVDRSRKPHSFDTGQRVHLTTKVETDYQRPDRNVLGYLPGTDPALRDRYLIISAHYDHVGQDIGGTVFHGAYDNASGVATMLETARVLAASPPRFSVLFAAWGAEESGMLGSAAYRSRPEFRADQLVGVINVDVVGGMTPVEVQLSRTDKDAPRILAFARQLGLKGKEVNQIGPSDGMSFSKTASPVIQLADEGSMDKIHDAGDTADKLDSGRLVVVARLVALQAWWWSDHPYWQ